MTTLTPEQTTYPFGVEINFDGSDALANLIRFAEGDGEVYEKFLTVARLVNGLMPPNGPQHEVDRNDPAGSAEDVLLLASSLPNSVQVIVNGLINSLAAE
jgi:hypothetical protein